MLLAAGALAGLAWSCGYAQVRLAESLPGELEGRDVYVAGVVAGLPQALDAGQRFVFEVEQSEAAGVPRRVLLGWYRGQREAQTEFAREVHAGERWRFKVRLKRPHGNLNPHGFDYEAQLFERGLRATGYVRAGAESLRLDEFVASPATLIERARENVSAYIRDAVPDSPYAGVLIALVIGDQQAIGADLWERFNRTGITHLVAISGVHVTMIAGLIAWLVAALWRRVPPLALRLPAQKAAALAGALAALAYCLLAGFAVPAQRTLYMLAVIALALWRGRIAGGSRVLALALLFVLLLDPLAVRSAGFWLSFGAVAVLFFGGSGRIGQVNRLRRAISAQWAVTLALIPALLALFQQFSLVSMPANAVAIPVVSLLITPLAIAGGLLHIDALLALANLLMTWLMLLLDWLAALPWAVWQQAAPPWWAVALGLLGCAVMLLPRGFPARSLGAVLLLPLLLTPAPRPEAGNAVVTVLDVGQGLAVHVQTAGHDMIYDTGPRFSLDANSGNRIILPYLRAAGVVRLDRLIVTHQDRDHSGGAESVLAGLPVALTQSSLAADSPYRLSAPGQQACIDGETWEWDGVRFEMLHPRAAAYALPVAKSNDLSCVLMVSAAAGRMLLTGDIESVSELDLVARYGQRLHAEVLLAPHHGSRTSSSEAFLDAVGAAQVVLPVGYRNRFRHPNGEVMARYAARAAALHRTDRDGAVRVLLGPAVSVERTREQRKRYWHAR
jgi:competence protein ComEC